MKVCVGIPASLTPARCALVIGNFDGVHRGHQIILSRLREVADRLGIVATVMIFEPHPREFFAGLINAEKTGQANKNHAAATSEKLPVSVTSLARITSLRDKLQLLAAAKVDKVIIQTFNSKLANLSAADFVEKILVQGLNIQALLVGQDFRYGAGRTGNVTTLQHDAQRYGFQLEILPDFLMEGMRVSSSEIRHALQKGHLDRAQQLLGRPYVISGHVVHGKKLGRTLGVPTLNLRIAHGRPALSGIFIVQIEGLESQPLPAIASLGTRPTLGDKQEVLLESHIFDYAQICYGKLIRVEFLTKLRDEKKYQSLVELTEAMMSDLQQARQWFKARAAFIDTDIKNHQSLN